MSAFAKNSERVEQAAADIPIIDFRPDQTREAGLQWLRQYQHLKARVNAVAAEFGQGPPCEALRSRDLSQAQASSSAALQRLEADVWGQVHHVRSAVQAVTNTLSHVRPGYAPVEDLAAAIDTADRALAAVRDQHHESFEQLYQEEAQLEADIEAIASRLDTDFINDVERVSSGAPNTSARRPASAGPRRATSQPRQRRSSTGIGTLAPEVQEYDDFLAEHGPTGGWDPEDHDEFLAVLRSCDGDYQHCCSIVMERAVGYSRAEVVAHARWHMELLDLEVRKRLALERWRQKRQAERAAATAAQSVLQSDTSDLAQRERERDQHGRKVEQAYGEAKKAWVARWKEERAEQQRAAAEAARQQAEAQAAAKREELQRRQMENKFRLEVCKDAKERQRHEAERRAAAEAAIKAALSVPTPQQQQRVAERSSATFQRRQSLLARQEEARGQRERVQQQLLEKVHVEAPPDPSRLLKGTAAHMQRVEAARAEERQARDSGFILHVSKRVVPSWRAGVPGA